MSVAGSKLGSTFEQGYGTGSSEIFQTDSTVAVARDIYGQENQYNKLRQAERRQDRNDADKTINSPVDFWAKDKDVLMPKYNELLDKAAKYRSKVDNPFTGYSSDPEVQSFQKEWREFKGMASQSASEKSEFEKYQTKLFDKNSNALDPESKKQLDEYYNKPISERWGKTPPQMRVKDPFANFYGHASQVAKLSEKKDFTTQEADKWVEENTVQDPEFKERNSLLAKNAYENMSPELKKAAKMEFGTDANGNIDFVSMGKEYFKRNFKLAANVQDYDYSKVLMEIGEKAGDFTDRERDTKGNIIMRLNSGKAAEKTKSAIKTLIESRMMSDRKFSDALIAKYMPMIDKTGLDKLSEKEEADAIYEKIIDKAIGISFAQKPQSEQDLSAVAPKITINNNTGTSEQGGDLFNTWLRNAAMATGLKNKEGKYLAHDWHGETSIAGADVPETRLLKGQMIDGRKVADIRVRAQDDTFGKKGTPYVRVQFAPLDYQRTSDNPDKKDFRDYYLDKPEDVQSLRDAVMQSYREKGSKKDGTKISNYKHTGSGSKSNPNDEFNLGF